ncbi:uncharacterized protein LOC108036495 [Drosophila biarmipes]|uniref:uncharacterized protein LOC108036495 n=1 Tax=Drosophila biarmipes TaxID=125945 RepID=UPI0007E5F774|nr:uncharacterized protein LOC108036495 [Drosophila biarmipes]
MTRKEIATPRCGTITKLVVSIGSGETFITYADASTRSFCANPSWLNFQNGMMELGPVSEPSPHDQPSEAAAFLERHFGRKPKVRASMATHQRLASMDLKARSSEVNFQDRDVVIWHTWLVEKVRFPPAQCAIIEEWKDPFTETLGSCYCAWHLQNCMAWKLIIGNITTEAKCFCLRIKKTMDKVNHLLNTELDPGESTPENVLSATHLLKKLNDLLELQEKRNRRYKGLYKVEISERPRMEC